MKAEIEIGSKKFNVDFSEGKDISIPLDFNNLQPNTYGVDIATSKAYRDGQFIGDTRLGGPCNFETLKFTPHCNGTHTECIGHLTDKRINILSSLKDEMIPSTVITITPKKLEDSYVPDLEDSDLLITKNDLVDKLLPFDNNFYKAIIIRTLPNKNDKMHTDYMQNKPPFFSIEAMQYIVSLEVTHLLVDIPSVDRLYDDGNLTAHNLFWKTKSKKFNPNTKSKTITEMIYVPEDISDGSYLLNLQIPAFLSDAAPSRPILYELNEV
jgi:kynurenine formamidase